MEQLTHRSPLHDAALKQPLKICVTGAAGNLAYSLFPYLINGSLFGYDQPVILHLLDINPMMGVLHGVQMELDDCCFPLLKETLLFSDPMLAFKDVSYAILLGAMPRKEGMSRRDLLQSNVSIFKEQGKALNQVAKKDVKVLVVGNPANTNCLVIMHYAPTIPRENFSALTRLDANRATDMIANHLKIRPDKVRNVIIWGNHSSTQFPDAGHAYLHDYPHFGQTTKVVDAIKDESWLSSTFSKSIQERGTAVIAARKQSSAMSAAKAVADHLYSWICGTPEGSYVSMAVFSSRSIYNVPEGLVFSFPVTITGGKFKIVEGLTMNKRAQEMMNTTIQELIAEKEEALSTLEP